MLNVEAKIITHQPGLSHSTIPANLTATGAIWCRICQGFFGPAVDYVLVEKLAPKVAHFLEHGHGDTAPKKPSQSLKPIGKCAACDQLLPSCICEDEDEEPELVRHSAAWQEAKHQHEADFPTYEEWFND